jgi:hypothetical protein
MRAMHELLKPMTSSGNTMLLRVTLASVLMITTAAVRAQYNAPDGGAPSCGKWVADGRATDRTDYYVSLHWVLGFLSGIEHRNGQIGNDPLNRFNAAAVGDWMDNYCRSHPIENIAGAGAAFFHAHPS